LLFGEILKGKNESRFHVGLTDRKATATAGLSTSLRFAQDDGVFLI
jgi:hypothetical protein